MTFLLAAPFIISPRWNRDFISVIFASPTSGNMRKSKIIINLLWGVIYLYASVHVCVCVCLWRSHIAGIGQCWCWSGRVRGGRRLRYWFSWRQIRLECPTNKQTSNRIEQAGSNFQPLCQFVVHYSDLSPSSANRVRFYLPKWSCE